MQFVITPGDIFTVVVVLLFFVGYFFLWLSSRRTSKRNREALERKNPVPTPPDQAPPGA